MLVVINRINHSGMEDQHSVLLFDDDEFDPVTVPAVDIFAAFSIFVKDERAAISIVRSIEQNSASPIKVRRAINGEVADA